MTVAIQRRRGTTSQHSAFSGLQGELTVDTSKNTVVVHDGATLGGHPLALESVVSGLSGGVSSHVGATSGVHGVSGDVVGTTGTQTLTNKTLTSPVVNSPTISDPVINGAAFKPSAASRSICGTAYHSLLGIVCPPSFERKAWDSKDLTNGIPTGMTFSRPSTATYFDAAGVMQSAASGALRHDFDPATGEYRGWLLEGQSTNLLLYSQDFTNAAWNKANGLTATASRLQASSTSSTAYQNVSISADTQTRCYSWRVKKTSTSTAVKLLAQAYGGTAQVYVVTLNPSTGDLSSVSVGGAYGVIGVGDAWLVYMTLTNNGTNTGVQLQVQPDVSAGTGYAEMAGVQLEVGSYPTSYIPTTSAQVTRAADRLYIATSAFPFNTLEGTIYAEYESFKPNTSGSACIEIDAGDWTNSIALGINPSNCPGASVVSGSSSVVSITLGAAMVSGAFHRSAFGFKSGSFAAVYDGGAPFTSSASGMPTVTTFSIGCDGSGTQSLNGHIRHIAYFPRRLSNTELQLLTK